MHTSTLRFVFKLMGIAAVGLSTLLPANAAEAKKADPTGTWTWTQPGRDGGPGRTSTLKLKLDGEKVTGAVSSPGREGAVMETAISEGKLAGDELTFEVTREFNGNKFTSKYAGKVGADSIKGKIETERNGEKQSRDWEAKRVVETKETEKKEAK